MKKELTCVLMLTLILTSMLSVAFAVKPSFAIDAKYGLLSDDSAKRIGQTTSRDRAVKQDPEQSQSLESPIQGQKRGNDENRWNFSDPSAWENSTFADGNKTRLIVGVDSDKPSSLVELARVAIKHQGIIVDEVSIGRKVRALVVELQLACVTGFVGEVQGMGLASYVEPNLRFQALFTPNDPKWNLQWGPQRVGADWAWNITTGNHTVLVAVIDTGIDYTHPDLAANYVSLGYDWAYMDSDPKDDFGHGTHCAGIIAAELNNSVGIAGLAQVRIMAEKVLDYSGYGYADWLANGIVDAVNQGANILSISLGGYGDSELVHEAVRYAYDEGVLLIASAGNDNTNTKSYPAAYDEVVAVAATDQYDGKASFSNWGEWIELAAPGVSIYSTMPTYHVTLNNYGYAMDYDYLSGTSMACPHVSGTAALVWSRYPDKARDWARLWLRYTADDLGDQGFDIYYGYGRANARKAVEQTPPTHELIAYEWRTPRYVEPGTLGVINATVLNFGDSDETGVTVQLLANDTMVDSAVISLIADGNATTVNLTWTPIVEGVLNVTFCVVPVLGETSVENNVLWKYIYVGFPVKAVVLHSAGNIAGDIITNWQVLSSDWALFGDKMVYIDYETLNKENITYADIVSTEADVLIISCAYDPYAGWEFTDSEIGAVTQYVHEGHGLIATAGTLYSMVPNNNKLAPLFGLNETTMWSATATDLLDVLNATHPIFNHVPNPLVFPQVETNLPYDGRWDSNELAGGKYLALGHFQESAIVTYRGCVYISPWLELIPPYYHHPLQLLYNAITWSRYQKPEHELIVSLKGPQHLKPGESALLNATVNNEGHNNETNVHLQLFIDGAMVDSATIPELQVDSSCTISYPWVSTVQGVYNVTAYAQPVLGEELTENNIARRTVMVLLFAVRNALVYSDDYQVAPDLRYVIVALNDLGINYTYYSDDPWGFGAALVSQPWDLVVVDHCNYYGVGNYWNELEEYVRNGGCLIVSTFDIDGSHSEPTTLWDTMGVRWVSDMSHPEPVHRWIPSHPLFTFPNTVSDLTSYMEGYFDHGDHVANTTGMAVGGFTEMSTDGYAGIVVGNTCPTVVFSFTLDEFRYDQDSDGKLDAIELWENAIVYLARGYEHDVAVTLNAASFLNPGDSTLLNATVSNRGLNNETNVELQLLIEDTITESATILLLQPGDSYAFSYLWTPTTEAEYNVTTYAPPVPNENVTTNNAVMKTVTVKKTINVAVLGDYFSQLTNLLLNTSILAYERDWDVIENIYDYDVIIVNRPYDPGPSTFMSLIEAADEYRVGLVFTSSWPGSDAPYGISLLQRYLGDPAGQDRTYGTGSVYYQVVKEHPIFEGWNVGDKIYLITTGDRDHAWFWAYSGETVADLGDDYYEIRGGGIAYKIRENGNKHLLLAGLAPQYYANTAHWTEAAKLVFVRGVWWASKPVVYEHDLNVTLNAPTSLQCKDSALVDYAVRNAGLNNETGVALSLLINGSIVNSITIPALHMDESYTASYLWTPGLAGDYNITAYAPPVPGEDYIANNNVTTWFTVQGIHDVAVTNVEPSSHEVLAGNPVDVNVNVENQGDYPESFTVTAYAVPKGSLTTITDAISNSTRVFLDPSKYMFNPNSVSIGYMFNVTVKVADVENLIGWQVKMYYNNSIINATRWFEPTWDPEYVFYGQLTIQAESVDPDYMWVYAGLLGEQSVFNGTGKLCIIEFEIVDVPTHGETYSCSLGINNKDTALFDQDVNVIPAIMEDGYYELSSGPPLAECAIGTVVISDLGPGEKRTMTVTWDTTEVLPWDYEMSAMTGAVQGETDTGDNTFTDGIVKVTGHDVAIIEVNPSHQWVYQGFSVNVSVTVENKGNSAENVVVTLYYNITANKVIDVQVISILPGENQTIIFTWNTAGVQYCHNYTITAVASIPFDSNPSDNTFADGGIKVRIRGDINGDGKVDGKDITIVALSFASYAGQPPPTRWTQDADINQDGKIDGKDLTLVAINFGTCTP